MNAMTMNLTKDRPITEYVLDTTVTPRTIPTEPCSTPVPLKPTAAMLASGSRAGGVSVETAWRIYLAMINEAA